MTRETLIKHTIDNLAKLPDQKLKEVSDFAEFLLKRIENRIVTEGIQKLVTDSSTWTPTLFQNKNSFTWTRTRQQNVTDDLRQVVNKKVTVDAPEPTTKCFFNGAVTCNPKFISSFNVLCRGQDAASEAHH